MSSPRADGAVLADDGCRLWVIESGHGEPLILCHGGPGLWDMFGTLAPVLAEHVRVIRWDQRGCGRSERRGPYSLARSVADLEAIRAHLGLDVPVLIIDSATDIRPRWSVDSLEGALPSATRVVLPGVGHVPWLERHERFTSVLLEWLGRGA